MDGGDPFKMEVLRTRSHFTQGRNECGLRSRTRKISSEKRLYAGGKKVSINSKEFTYVLDKRRGEDGMMYEIVSQTHSGLRCLRLEIITGSDTAYLQELGKYDGCISPNETKNFGKIILQIARDVLREFEPRVKYIELQDEAHSMCGKSYIKFNLSDMLLLTKGDTYYRCLGFSFKTASDTRAFNRNLEILKNRRWRDIKSRLTTVFPLDSFPDNWGVRRCFERVLQDDCDYLAEHLGDIFAMLGLQRNNGVVYVMAL